MDPRRHKVSPLRFAPVEMTVLFLEDCPGFAVFFEAGAGASVIGVEAEAFLVDYVGDGEDVPGVYGDDVGDQGVDVIFCVG